jgi:predicted acetylornithine/succinylornithine family transaminase
MTPVVTDLMMPTYRSRPIAFTSGRGSTLVTEDGTEYLDLVAGIAVASVGHSHPRVAAAIADQAQRLIHTSNLYGTAPQIELAGRLGAISNGKLSFFANSGAEAIECGLKLARKFHGGSRHRFIAADGGFHGRTFGALSATGQPAKQAPFQPIVPGFAHVPFGDIDALKAALDPSVAAVILEPIQGEGGVMVPPDGYLAEVRALCDQSGALLLLDEVQTGLGRTGTWFAAEHDDVEADIVCLAKALGGGLPIGACLARPEVAHAFVPGDHATTFGGGPVQCAAAVATLDVIEDEQLLLRARTTGERLATGLNKLGRGNVRGKGLMLAFDLGVSKAGDFAAAALERRVLVNEVTPSAIRLTPPLVITDPEVDTALDVFAKVLDEI